MASQRRPAWLFGPKPEYHLTFPPRRILITGGSGGVTTDIFDPSQNRFVAGPPMNAARVAHVAVSLGNGLVLAAGGLSESPTGGNYTSSAELYTGNGFQPIGNMTAARAGAAVSVLYSGRILITGGFGWDLNNPAEGPHQLASAEYLETICASDYRYQFVRTIGGMSQGRGGHTATAFLRSPLVLVAGGYDGGNSGITASAETYDQPQDVFTSVTPMRQQRMVHAACLLQDGRILVCGGTPDNHSDAVLRSAESFDPRSQGSFGFTNVGDMLEERESPTATLLNDGRVLVVGGFGANGQPLSSAELFDPVSNSFMATGSMHTGRVYHTATPLGDGRVLVTGGKPSSSVSSIASAEIYDPSTGHFTETSPMSIARSYHAATPI